MPNLKLINIKLCLWRRVEVSCFSTTTADAINTAKPCRAACDMWVKNSLGYCKPEKYSIWFRSTIDIYNKCYTCSICVCIACIRSDGWAGSSSLQLPDINNMSDAQSIRDGASSVASASSSRHKADPAAGGSSRRMSMSRRPSETGLSHQSNVGGRQGLHQNTVKLENTYRMELDERYRFQPTTVSKILGN